LDEPSHNHSAIVWSADSHRLAYMRLDQSNLGQPPGVFAYSLETETARPIQDGGYSPQWLP
jgi:hypothetical protein